MIAFAPLAVRDNSPIFATPNPPPPSRRKDPGFPGSSLDGFARGFARPRFMVEGPGRHEFTAFDDGLGPAVAWSRPQGA